MDCSVVKTMCANKKVVRGACEGHIWHVLQPLCVYFSLYLCPLPQDPLCLFVLYHQPLCVYPSLSIYHRLKPLCVYLSSTPIAPLCLSQSLYLSSTPSPSVSISLSIYLSSTPSPSVSICLSLYLSTLIMLPREGRCQRRPLSCSPVMLVFLC